MPKESSLQVLTESGYRCASPGCPHELTVELHHIVEVRNDGGHQPENLLPLCPYCHDKYHRKLVDQRAIVEWKARIRRIYQAAIERPENQKDPLASQGYEQAFSLFTRRTYPVWYFYDYDNRVMVHSAGFATFIKKNRLVTSRAVLDRLDLIRQVIPGGTPKLVLGFSTLNFIVERIYTWGGVVILKSSDVEEREFAGPQNIAESHPQLNDPDQSPYPKIAQIPFVGQEVAFLYGSSSSFEGFPRRLWYPLWDYAIGSSLVSAFLPTKPVSMDRYILSEIREPVTLLGGPVFLRDGTLVGVLSSLQRNESFSSEAPAPQLILGGFIGITELWKKD